MKTVQRMNIFIVSFGRLFSKEIDKKTMFKTQVDFQVIINKTKTILSKY